MKWRNLPSTLAVTLVFMFVSMLGLSQFAMSANQSPNYKDTDDGSKLESFEITYEVIGENGTLDAYINDHEYFDSGTMIEQDIEVNFDAHPNSGYTVKEWRINDQVVPGYAGQQLALFDIESNIYVSVEFIGLPQPEITPNFQFFGLDEAEDVTFTINWGNETEITNITHVYWDELDEYHEIILTEGTDYDITSNVLTIYASFIVSLSPEVNNELEFTVKFGSGWENWIGIGILQATSAQITPSELTYDLSNPGDVVSTVIWGVTALSVESISTVTKYDLIEGTDYHIDGAWLYLHNSYLTQNLTAVNDELSLNVLFDNADEVLLTITTIESGITNATIDPTSISFFEHEFPEYVDITITWNDATAVTNLNVMISDEWGSEQFDWPFYEVTDNGDGTANLRFYFDEEKKIKPLNAKAQEITYATVTIGFDVGAPALFLMTIIYEYYEVMVTINPESAGWVNGDWDYSPDEIVELEAFPNINYVFWSWNDAEGNPVSFDNPYIFDMPSQDVVLTALFKPIEYFAVNFSVLGSNGTLAGQSNGAPITSGDEIIIGSDLVFTATPEAGYRVKEWALNGVVVEGTTGFSFTIDALVASVDLTVEFELIPPMYTVIFTVTEGVNPIQGATVNFDGTDYTTNATGIATITDVETGTYSYTVSMTNYTDATGSVTVTDTDVNEPVLLTPSSAEQNSISSIRAYPNPFGNHITITNAEMVKRVVITNLTGQRVMSINLNGETTVNTDNLTSGIYLVTIEGHNGQRTIRKMIKQ